MAAFAVAELGRVPLASVIFHKHKLMQGIAILGIVALGYLAAENWTFGFERIVDLRLKSVNIASREQASSDAKLAILVERRRQMTTADGQKRDELRRGVDERDTKISELTEQLSKEAEVHQKNLEGIREACRLVKDKCIVPRSQAEDSRYVAEAGRLSADLALQREESRQLQSQIDELVSRDASELARLDQKIHIAEASVAEVRKSLRSAADGNRQEFEYIQAICSANKSGRMLQPRQCYACFPSKASKRQTRCKYRRSEIRQAPWARDRSLNRGNFSPECGLHRPLHRKKRLQRGSGEIRKQI
jgi:hypothetical protein